MMTDQTKLDLAKGIGKLDKRTTWVGLFVVGAVIFNLIEVVIWQTIDNAVNSMAFYIPSEVKEILENNINLSSIAQRLHISKDIIDDIQLMFSSCVFLFLLISLMNLPRAIKNEHSPVSALSNVFLWVLLFFISTNVKVSNWIDETERKTPTIETLKSSNLNEFNTTIQYLLEKNVLLSNIQILLTQHYLTYLPDEKKEYIQTAITDIAQDPSRLIALPDNLIYRLHKHTPTPELAKRAAEYEQDILSREQEDKQKLLSILLFQIPLSIALFILWRNMRKRTNRVQNVVFELLNLK